MKKYLYNGTSIFSFTNEGKDYLVHGSGPHSLPEAAPQVISAVGLGLLVEQIKETKENQPEKTKKNYE